MIIYTVESYDLRMCMKKYISVRKISREIIHGRSLFVLEDRGIFFVIRLTVLVLHVSGGRG